MTKPAPSAEVAVRPVDAALHPIETGALDGSATVGAVQALSATSNELLVPAVVAG